MLSLSMALLGNSYCDNIAIITLDTDIGNDLKSLYTPPGLDD